ncbi:major facilitator superfamily transporter [Diaporthe helianthi]|uniref:Major facilitator superfamily transporter n=1 Tax=Diaporthe helianthi TaxID=158607 RepID=A0A2P5HIH2_DIAHE|nr:major facilitator superfamily transporter [Diaporthe helianthi]
MSLNRVSSLESFSHLSIEGPRRSPSPSSRDRRLSFNPLPESWDPPASKPGYLESVGAFEVPKWKRVLQVFATVIYCLFAAGVVFGYAALKPVLKQEGAYQDVCGAGDSGASPDDVDTCVEIRLNLMFTVAAVSTNVAALPVGTILDHFGPRVCGLAGASFLTAGSLLMAFEDSLPFDGLLVGYLFLALGGPFTYISSFHLSNAFPKHPGLILALLTGAFDASSALFLIYRVIFEKTGGSFGHDKFFLAYLVVPLIIAVLQLVLLPRHSYKTIGEMIEQLDQSIPEVVQDQVDEHTALLEQERLEHRDAIAADLEDLIGSKRADKQQQREEKKNDISGVWGVMHPYTAWQQIRSPWFILICAFTVVQMTRINYFVATIRPQYEALLGSHDRAVQVNNFFDLALPIGGILSIPFIGLLLDHFSTVTVLFWLVTVTTAIGLLGVIPEMWAAYANIILFVLYRPFYYTAVSDYSAKVFGFKTFGTVYGTIICLSGLFNFSQSGLDYLLHQTFGGDPIPVNLVLLSLGLVVGVSMVLHVGYQSRGLKRKMVEMEAERAVGMYN